MKYEFVNGKNKNEAECRSEIKRLEKQYGLLFPDVLKNYYFLLSHQPDAVGVGRT